MHQVKPESQVQVDSRFPDLIDPVSVSFQGQVILFARPPGQETDKLYYNVRFELADAKSSTEEWQGWREVDLSEPDSAATGSGGNSAILPSLMRVSGMGLLTVPPVATRVEPADSAFRMEADEHYIYLFRPSRDGTLYLNRFILVEQPVEREDAETDDRELLLSFDIKPVWEIRYRRSGNKDVPAGPKDTRDFLSIDETPFVEPTLELPVVSGVDQGRFSVVLAPTSDLEVGRWHFFVNDSNNTQVHAYSFAQAKNGLFDFDKAPVEPSTITPKVLDKDGKPLSVNCTAGAAAAAAVFYDREQAATVQGEAQTLQRGAKLMLAIPVEGGDSGLSQATCIYDFGIRADGTIAHFTGEGVPVVDGTLENGAFTPKRGPDDNCYPTPSSAVFVIGDATVAGAVLGQASAQATPMLLDGGDGLVHLYYAGAPVIGTRTPFEVAQYNPGTTRFTVQHQWSAGTLSGEVAFVSERTGSSMNGMKVTVSDTDSPADQADLCNIAVDYGADSGIASEAWVGVPRRLDVFLEVLSGSAVGDAGSPQVMSGEVPFFDYSGSRYIARLPLQDLTAPAGHIALVDRRDDLPLHSISVTQPLDGHSTLTIRLGDSGQTVQMTWSNIPVRSDHLIPVLRGEVSPQTYPYTPQSGDTRILTVATSSGVILLLGTPTRVSDRATVTLSAASQSPESQCKVTIDPGTEPTFTIDNVPREQAGFLEALRKDSTITRLFFLLSGDAVEGEVVDQPETPVADLRIAATLFDTVPPATDDSIVSVNVTSGKINGHTVGGKAESGSNRLVAASALAVSQPDDGVEARVGNGSGNPSDPAVNGAWVWRPQPQAIGYDGANYMDVALDSSKASVLMPARGWTVEAWVKPKASTPSHVLHYNNGSATTPGGVVPSYFLGTTGRPAITYGPCNSTEAFAGSSVQVDANSIFLPDAAFTYECWIKPQTTPGPDGHIGVVFSVQNPDLPDAPVLQLGLTSTRELVFGYRDADDQYKDVTCSGFPLPEEQWVHVAVTGKFSASSKDWSVIFYCDATETHKEDALKLSTDTEAPLFFIGTQSIDDRSLYGSLNEMRFWDTCRSPAELKRTLFMSLSGYEPGLCGYWPLVEDPVNGATIANRCAATKGEHLDGQVKENASEQPMSRTEDGTFLSVIGGVGGGKARVGHGFLMASYWNHIAVTFQSGTAIRLNPPLATPRATFDYAVCGDSQEFNLAGVASLEAHIISDSFNNQEGAILSKWGINEVGRSYRLYLSKKGQLAMDLSLQTPIYSSDNPQLVVDYEPRVFTVQSSKVIAGDGKPHHIVGVYKNQGGIDKDNNDTPRARGVLALYIDGEQDGQLYTDWYDFVSELALTTTTSDVCIGMQGYTGKDTPKVAIESQAYFTGVLTGVRIWSDALSQPRIRSIVGQHMKENEGGLVSAWWFAEQAGKIARDSASSNNATLSSGNLWVLYSPLSTTTLYANGYRIGLYDDADDAEKAGYTEGSRQCTSGGYIDNGTCKAGFNGDAQELRLWSVARTMGELINDKNRPLTGYEHHLAGYWPFDGSTEDRSGMDNPGTLKGNPQPEYKASSAPVAYEAPPVRNIYSDHITGYQEPVEGTPAVIEYGDVQRSSDGTLFSVRKRAYFFVNDTMTMVPDFKVGDLDLVHIGQVQSEPTLMGFIEGAPPVPSENLSRPLYNSAFAYNGYYDATDIALTQAGSVTYGFSTRDYSTTQMQSTSIAAGVFGNWKVSTNQGSPFFSIGDEKFTNTAKLGIKAQIDHSEANTEDHSLSSGWTDTLVDSLSLRGSWEPDQAKQTDYLNPQVGRRFIPDNIGYALVESLTADLFSMQIRGTGHMVGKVVLPNPDIPPDKNIITFKINPRYVKNGTLDGKVGLVNDPDYPNADFVKGSYFRAREAYLLKDRIEQESRELAAYYEQFNAQRRGRNKNTGLSEAEDLQFYDWSDKVIRKSMVNSYVWSARGGLHKEEQQMVAERRSSFGGNYKLTYLVGPSFQLQLAFYIGVYGGVDMLFGSQVDVTVSQEKNESQSFGMAAAVNTDPMLLAWDPGTSEGSGAYTANLCPGKVDSYRFMSFYLAPDTDNARAFLDSVVDPQWSTFSNDPNAVALRGARIADNKVWRILHRVTYVSRVPPDFNNTPCQRVSNTRERVISVSDNQLLIKIIQKALGSRSPTPVNMGAAITEVMTPQNSSAGLSLILPWWQGFLDKTRQSPPDEKAVKLMSKLRKEMLDFMLEGYGNGQLPIK